MRNGGRALSIYHRTESLGRVYRDAQYSPYRTAGEWQEGTPHGGAAKGAVGVGQGEAMGAGLLQFLPVFSVGLSSWTIGLSTASAMMTAYIAPSIMSRGFNSIGWRIE